MAIIELINNLKTYTETKSVATSNAHERLLAAAAQALLRKQQLQIEDPQNEVDHLHSLLECEEIIQSAITHHISLEEIEKAMANNRERQEKVIQLASSYNLLLVQKQRECQGDSHQMATARTTAETLRESIVQQMAKWGISIEELSDAVKTTNEYLHA